MSLYPSIEALTIGKEEVAQKNLEKAVIAAAANTPAAAGSSISYGDLASSFLGLDLSRVWYDDYGNPHLTDDTPKPTSNKSAVVPKAAASVVPVRPAGAIVAKDPVTVSQQVREVHLIKDKRGCIGVQLKELDAGVFITYVECDSPAANAGLRFGDQVLKIDDEYMAGQKGKKAMKFVRKKCGDVVTMVLRDRPLERVVTLSKDSHGSVGLLIDDGLVKSIVKDSSAERNGVLIHTYICEVNGVNVLGIPDKEIRQLIDMAGNQVKLTLLPEFYFDELTKKLGRRHWKNMDRTMPLY